MSTDPMPPFYHEAERFVRIRGRADAAKLCAALLSEVHAIPQSLDQDEARNHHPGDGRGGDRRAGDSPEGGSQWNLIRSLNLSGSSGSILLTIQA